MPKFKPGQAPSLCCGMWALTPMPSCADGETDLCSALCTIARLQSRVEHQEQRINDVAFRYEAMFGMDTLFRIVHPMPFARSL